MKIEATAKEVKRDSSNNVNSNKSIRIKFRDQCLDYDRPIAESIKALICEFGRVAVSSIPVKTDSVITEQINSVCFG